MNRVNDIINYRQEFSNSRGRITDQWEKGEIVG